MLAHLELKNVGFVKSMKIDFKRRINVITRDNGFRLLHIVG